MTGHWVSGAGKIATRWNRIHSHSKCRTKPLSCEGSPPNECGPTTEVAGPLNQITRSTSLVLTLHNPSSDTHSDRDKYPLNSRHSQAHSRMRHTRLGSSQRLKTLRSTWPRCRASGSTTCFSSHSHLLTNRPHPWPTSKWKRMSPHNKRTNRRLHRDRFRFRSSCTRRYNHWHIP